MEARLVAELPKEQGWQYEPKWDGFRCLAFKNKQKVELRAKSGKPLTRYFPEVVAALKTAKAERFVLDGELIIEQGETLSFDALQMRLHPAQSRIDKLSRETPALLMCFDMLLGASGDVLVDKPLHVRRAALEAFFATDTPLLRLSPFSRKRSDAQRWLSNTGRGALDGIVAKQIDQHYFPGERAMLKIKCLRTADCVVGGFRYETDSKLVGSMLLGLYNADGKLDHVGFTSAFRMKRAKP
ncbi:MAG: ATP-dependent DNA ligase [Rhizomicrobium sp.]